MLRRNSLIQSASKLKLFLFLFFSLGMWQIGVQPASADTLTVCQIGGCDFSTIQAAINASNNGDILDFTVNDSAETYFETITLSKSLTFIGQKTSISAPTGGPVVTINGNPTVVMQNINIQNGSVTGNGAGVRLNGGNLTLTDVTISGNDATGASSQGGALYIASSSSTVQLTDVSMQLNTAVSGGAIYNNGTLTADNLALTDNTAQEGGGLFNNATATLDNLSTVQRNEATQDGGGLFNTSGAMLTLLNSTVANNDAVNGAGIANEGTLQLTGVNVGSGNVATNAGGGLHNSGQATLSNSTLVQNQSDIGAGIYNEGTLTATNSTLSRNAGPDNQPSVNGPGLYNMSGNATLNNVTIHLTIGTSIFANGGSITVGNTIISSVSGQSACGGGGTVNSNGYNLANDESCTFLSVANGDLENIDPDLNGIETPSIGAAFHSPKLTSPAVDAGNPATPGSSSTACLASDKNSLSRPQSRQCDIGAVEIVVYRLYLPTVTN